MTSLDADQRVRSAFDYYPALVILIAAAWLASLVLAFVGLAIAGSMR